MSKNIVTINKRIFELPSNGKLLKEVLLDLIEEFYKEKSTICSMNIYLTKRSLKKMYKHLGDDKFKVFLNEAPSLSTSKKGIKFIRDKYPNYLK